MLLFGKNLQQHRGWLYFVVAATAGASIWFFWESRGTSQWPSGSSLPGFTFGVLSGLIILFECSLWVRKKLRVWRIGQVQVWMRAHIWLGLLVVPLAIYHTGFRMGGALSSWLMILMLIVVASGIWGLVMQQWLPRRLYEEVPAETIYSQIPRLSAQLIMEADQLVRSVCGAAPDEPVEAAVGVAETKAHFVLGAVRTVGKVQGKVLETRSTTEPVPDSEALRAFFQQTVTPFLHGSPDSPLWLPARSTAMFQELKAQLPPPAHSAVDALADFCGQRRQWEAQARMYKWLHNWLWIHLPLSVALLVLLAAHIYGAIRYW